MLRITSIHKIIELKNIEQEVRKNSFILFWSEKFQKSEYLHVNFWENYMKKEFKSEQEEIIFQYICFYAWNMISSSKNVQATDNPTICNCILNTFQQNIKCVNMRKASITFLKCFHNSLWPFLWIKDTFAVYRTTQKTILSKRICSFY